MLSSTAKRSQRGRLETFLFQAVDAGMLAYFRIVFGGLMFLTLSQKLSSGSVSYNYVLPRFHFTYPGLAWLGPLPDVGMYLLFGMLVVCALGIALGLLYRAAAILFALGSTYVFLLDQAYYLNHEYLICLLAWLLVVIPCHRTWSVDARWFPARRRETVPAWMLNLLRFQVALPYVFGGIAKLDPDWLRGQPLRSWLPESPLPHLLGEMTHSVWFAMAMSWTGLIFDLAVVPLLLWERTRKVAFAAAAVFHLANATTFDIDVFPWLMLFSVFVFFPADWPRKILNLPVPRDFPERHAPRTALRRNLLIAALGVYVVVHCVLPLRHLLIPGNANWTAEGHDLAWRMMLRDKNTALQFVVKNQKSGAKQGIDPHHWLNRVQVEAMGHEPELIRQFAHFLKHEYRAAGVNDVSIHVIAIVSMNGRKPQFLFDPRLDLSEVPPRKNPVLGHAEWIFPLTEPFRHDPWNRPGHEWLEHVDRRELLDEL